MNIYAFQFIQYLGSSIVELQKNNLLKFLERFIGYDNSFILFDILIF